MISLIKAAIVSVICGATADGVSTDYAINKLGGGRGGIREIDPIMVKIFGTTTPSTKTIFLRGGIAVALESLISLTAAHFNSTAGHVLAVVLLVQTAYHVWATTHNYRLK